MGVMREFSYRAFDPNLQQQTSGIEIARTIDEAKHAIAQRGHVVLRLHRRWLASESLTRTEVLAFTHSMAALIAAGVPLLGAIAASGKSVGSPSVINRLTADLEAGSTLSSTMKANRIFPSFYTAVVFSGELAGDLKGAFERLGTLLDKEAALRSRLLSASIYPALLAIVSVLSCAFLVSFVLPRFSAVLLDTGIELPRSTTIMLAIGTALRSALPVGGMIALIVGVLMFSLRNSTRAKGMMAAFTLGVPVVGNVRRNILAARFGSLLSVLLRGGIPLSVAMREAGEAIGDPVYSGAIANMHASLQNGSSFQSTLAESDIFPPVFVQLAAIGESAAKLPEFLERAATLCADSAEKTLSRLIALMEPVLILGFGVVIGAIAVSLLSAVYSVNGSALR
jgi:type II secretory pathway component PulF